MTGTNAHHKNKIKMQFFYDFSLIVSLQSSSVRINTVFICVVEIGEFRTAVEEAGLEFFMFKQANTLLKQYGDGGMAIIDQWICAHAR